MRRRARAAAILLIALPGLWVAAPRAAEAHPHVFIEQTITIRFGPAGVEGVDLVWAFDEMTSGLILLEFDADRDGALSPKEAKTLEATHFGNLKRYNYFLDIRWDEAPLPVTGIRDFQVRTKDGRVTYQFSVPAKAAALERGNLEVIVRDPTLFTAFEPRATTPVLVKTPREYAVDCRASTDSEGFGSEIVRCDYRRMRR